MCKVITRKIGKRDVRVADIKADYIENIANSALLCDKISRIILFGSATEGRCTDRSDIDIAVFGNLSKSKMYSSRGYRAFINSVVSFGGAQDYDILYFDDRKPSQDAIMSEIQKGEVLYTKE